MQNPSTRGIGKGGRPSRRNFYRGDYAERMEPVLVNNRSCKGGNFRGTATLPLYSDTNGSGAVTARGFEWEF